MKEFTYQLLVEYRPLEHQATIIWVQDLPIRKGGGIFSIPNVMPMTANF